MDQETSDYMFIYLDIILEYLDRMQKSKYMMGNLNREFLIYSGFRAITHIFQITYIYTNNLCTSFLNSQNAYVFYLEYLEQMDNTNANHDLNYTDAIQFLYSKTIYQLTPIDNIKPTVKYAMVSKLTDSIIWSGEMRTIKKQTIINCFRVDYETILFCLEIAKLRKMDNTEYESFLCEIYSMLKKKKYTDLDIQKIYKIRDINNSLGLNLKQWCKWLMISH